MTTTYAIENPLMAEMTGGEILGEIVTWDVDALEVRHTDLVRALVDADLDPNLSRPMCESNAFRRAIKHLRDSRIIRKVDESKEIVRFQFTAEHKDVSMDCLAYDMETIVSLHKESGNIECPNPEIAAKAREAVDREIANRNGADVSRIVFRLFDDKRRAELDLVPLRKSGGVYFVRREGTGFLDRVEGFLTSLNARLNRFPIAKTKDNRSVQEAVSDKMAALVREYQEAVEDFGLDTRESTLKAAAERVELLAFKVESYAEYLATEKDYLSDAVVEARKHLARKLAELASERGRLATV